MNKLILLAFCIILSQAGFAQTGKSQVVRINATANTNGTVSLTWPAETWAGTWIIYRKTLGNPDWGNAVTSVTGSGNTWTDVSVKKGDKFEYLIVKTSGANTSALGYIYAGNTVAEQPAMGGIILLIDSNYQIPLSKEISTMENQLKQEGWQVSTLYAGRTETPENVRKRIVAEYGRRKNQVKSLMILGRVPVPYSGNFLAATGSVYPPDGHPDHAGAWPADGYYGDMDGIWTDASVTNTAASQSRNYNNPGDGKFDQTKFPDMVDLEVGRIDLYNMPGFSKNDTLLVRKYLQRNMLWRNNRLVTVERALIDDNFGTLNLSSTGYQNFSAMLRNDSIFDNRDYITSQKTGAYLWSYGCGGGSNTSCGGIGTTSSFVADSMRNIYTMLAGSYFGDWDQQNNFLRAPLCNSALICAWGGLPKWYFHHMGLGMNVGFGAKLTMNNVNEYFNGGFNMSENNVHIALMGDPTLKMRHVAPVNKVTAISQSNRVKLNWNKASGSHDGYIVYRFDSTDNSYYRVNKNFIIKDTFYTDSTNYFNGKNTYAVRATRLETTASGSWYNLGAGAFATVMHTNRLKHLPKQHVAMNPNPASTSVTLALPWAATEGTRIIVADVTGRTIFEETPLAGIKTADVRVETLIPGCYLVLVQQNGKLIAVEKLIKN